MSGIETISTRLARFVLSQQGIPCVTGHDAGLPYVDLAAWGCIPIEAKATLLENETLRWGFTPRQRRLQHLSEFFLFMGVELPFTIRTFVVLSSELTNERGILRASAFSAKVDCSKSDSNWHLLRKYENAFFLIEEARVTASNTLSSDIVLEKKILLIEEFYAKCKQMEQKGRHSSRLTNEDVLLIKELYNSGNISKAELARMFNITAQAVSAILNNKNWTWLSSNDDSE